MAIQQLLEPRRNSLADTFILAQNLKSARSQNALASRKVQEYEREERVREELARAYAGGADPSTEEGFRSLAAIDPESALEARKTGLEGERAEVDLETAQLESQFKRAERGAQILSGVRDEGSWQWAKKRAAAEGLPTEDLPENYDPAFIEQRMSEGMRVKDQISQRLKEKEFEAEQGYQQQRLDISRGQLGVSQAGAAEARRYHEASLAQAQATGERTAAAAESAATTGLRKEFNALPEVKNYTEIVPIVQSAREAVNVDNPAADLNLIYAAAKVMDPASVVRESETAMVIEAGSPAERFKGQFSYILGGGRLTAEARKQLMDEIESRAKGHEGLYQSAVEQYQSGAPEIGALPRLRAGRGAGGVDVQGGSARQRAIEALRAKGIPGY